MKYVALLSGGKDSCYNLLHCARNGHVLVAAASLGPGQGKEELDSYMYQTVGQDAIEFVAQALDVPLYRRVISGAALAQGSEYGTRSPEGSGGVLGDETEDMYALLSDVKSHHPDIQGVSVGAILSNYQRVRVEHVCHRLNLTPLTYLWQRDQGQLFSEMVDAGLEAIIIKVAGIGLTTKHLGKSLSDMQPTLLKLNERYGSHICGEGGEYETLTLDCSLFKRRIRVTESETVIHSDNAFATVAYLRIKDVFLEPKIEDPHIQLMVPPLLSEDYIDIRDAIAGISSDSSAEDRSHICHGVDSVNPGITSKVSGPWMSVANVQRDISDCRVLNMSVEDEVRDCFHRLQGRLQENSLELSDAVNINIFIASMDLFAQVNAVYTTFFGSSPPSRACVAVDLPTSIRVRLDCIAYAEGSRTNRQALHVQGLSYWAPANIGPYSQAVTVNERIFISGQIGLVPCSLSLPEPRSLALEVALSCQHVDRIRHALQNNTGGGWKGHIQSALYWLTNIRDVTLVRTAYQSYGKENRAATLFLVVPSLPKGALVEKQVLLHTGRFLVLDDDDLVLRSVEPLYAQGHLSGDAGSVYWEISSFTGSDEACAIVCFRGQSELFLDRLKTMPSLDRAWDHALSVRLFYGASGASFASSLAKSLEFLEQVPITLVPCSFISSRMADDWDYAMCILCT